MTPKEINTTSKAEYLQEIEEILSNCQAEIAMINSQLEGYDYAVETLEITISRSHKSRVYKEINETVEAKETLDNSSFVKQIESFRKQVEKDQKNFIGHYTKLRHLKKAILQNLYDELDKGAQNKFKQIFGADPSQIKHSEYYRALAMVEKYINQRGERAAKNLGLL